MALKIAIIGTGFTPSGDTAPPAEIAEIVSDNFSATLFETEATEFPSTPTKRALVVASYVELGLKIDALGYDAIYLNTVGDYGLSELRKKLNIPVIGAGETAVMTASHMSELFSIVTIWPESMNFIYADLLQTTDTKKQCREIEYLSEDDDLQQLANENNFVTELRSCSIDALNALEQAIKKHSEKSSDCIIIGCTCMAPAVRKLPDLSIPLLDPMTLGYRFCEYWLTAQTSTKPPLKSFAGTTITQDL